jgi:hypothetical protein
VANLEADLGARVAGEDFDGLVEAEVLGGFALDLEDEVAGHDAGAIGGGAFEGRDDGEDALAHADLDADAAEATADVALEVGEFVFGDVVGERIEAGEHAVDGILEELLGVDVADVLFLDEAEDLDEPLGLLEGLGVLGFLFGGGLEGPEQQTAHDGDEDDTPEIPTQHS